MEMYVLIQIIARLAYAVHQFMVFSKIINFIMKENAYSKKISKNILIKDSCFNVLQMIKIHSILKMDN